MKKIQIILLVLIIVGVGLLATQKYWVDPLVQFILKQSGENVSEDDLPVIPRVEEPTTTQCLPEQRNVDACIEIYAPVCATVEIQCIKAPCYPIQQTFPNSCHACKNSLVKSYVPGECPKVQ